VHAFEESPQRAVDEPLVGDGKGNEDRGDREREREEPEPPPALDERAKLLAVLPDLEGSVAALEQRGLHGNPGPESFDARFRACTLSVPFRVPKERVDVLVATAHVRVLEGARRVMPAASTAASISAAMGRRPDPAGLRCAAVPARASHHERQGSENQRHDHAVMGPPPGGIPDRNVVLAHGLVVYESYQPRS
jgi:hypothetical protein